MSKCKTCGTPSTYIKGVRKLRDKLETSKETLSFQKTVISDLKKDLKEATAKNTTLENALVRLKTKKIEISEEVEKLRKKSAMLERLEAKLKKDIEKAHGLVWKEQEERARLHDRLKHIRKAARDLYGITK